MLSHFYRTCLLLSATTLFTACYDSGERIGDNLSGDGGSFVDAGIFVDVGIVVDGSTTVTTDAGLSPDGGRAPICGTAAGIECANPDDYCDFVGCGGPDATGVCTGRPDVCPEEDAPVCGCDNVTYGNACFAQSAGASVAHTGSCDCIHIAPTTGLFTTEGGSMVTATATLDCAPVADVVLQFASTDTGEGTISPLSITFNSADWAIPRTLTIQGVDDGIIDGDQLYRITTEVSSSDPTYTALNPADISLTSVDRDAPTSTACEGNAAGGTCAPGRYCDYGDMSCGLTGLGVCRSRPDGCPAVVGRPVCGCDGVTHPSRCDAHALGASVAHDGPC